LIVEYVVTVSGSVKSARTPAVPALAGCCMLPH